MVVLFFSFSSVSSTISPTVFWYSSQCLTVVEHLCMWPEMKWEERQLKINIFFSSSTFHSFIQSLTHSLTHFAPLVEHFIQVFVFFFLTSSLEEKFSSLVIGCNFVSWDVKSSEWRGALGFIEVWRMFYSINRKQIESQCLFWIHQLESMKMWIKPAAQFSQSIQNWEKPLDPHILTPPIPK